MPRRKTLAGSAQFPKEFRANMPFLKQFCEECIVPSTDEKTTTEDTFSHYTAFVTVKTNDAAVLRIASSKARFSRQFSSMARMSQFEFVPFTGPKRGYHIRLQRPTRRYGSLAGPHVHNMIFEFLKKPDNSFVEPIEVSKEQGSGLFTAKETPEGTVICEYLGQEIPTVEGFTRDVKYETQGKAPRVIFFEKSCFDGNVDRNGDAIKNIKDNFGALINHSRSEFNCKWVKVSVEGITRVAVVTLKTLPSKVQLFVNYGDRRRHLESWMY